MKEVEESMKPERFKRTKSVMASSAIALLVAALVMGISSLVLGSKSASSEHLGFGLTSGSSSFTITGTAYTTPSGAYPAATCSGTPAPLSPDVTRCVVFSVHDNLKANITVTGITTALDTTNYPAPPADCTGTNLVLPNFSGSLNVTGGGDATTPGEPMELKNDGAPQNDCKNLTYHFVYSGSASYAEIYGTSTGVASSSSPSTAGQSVTYTATVTASATAGQDTVPSSPTGTVTFEDNGATLCNSVPVSSTGNTTATAPCTVNYTTPAGSPHSITASYVNTDGNFTGSNGSLSQPVTSGSTPTRSSLTSSPNPSAFGTPVTFTDTVSASPGTPGGTVTFYDCTTTTCSTKTPLGTRTLNGSGKTIYSTSSLPVGTTHVEAVYGASGNDLGSASDVVSQVVKALSTTSSLASSPNPSAFGTPVNFTDTVSASSGTPGGTVTFYDCTTTCSTKSPLGTRMLNGSGKATYSTSSLPVGTTHVEAVYGASGNDLGSTSNVASQTVLGVPSVCSGGRYGTYILGHPALPVINGTNGNDLLYAFGGNYRVNGFAGSDCIVAGNGTNVLMDGDGNDGVTAGDGSDSAVLGNGNDTVTAGNGRDSVQAGNGRDVVTLGGGSGDVVNLGDGTDSIALGNGSGGHVVVGDGSDTITVGSGSYNDVSLGRGTDAVSIRGTHDDIEGGAGNETVYLGSGSYNSYSGQAHHTNVCHLPAPPPSYHGSAATYYHDTIANCTVVSP
jgi:Ca2+-binding RTX toxin-like protein